ncbi:MAG: choice-of-anchor Q domain-containing protein [Pirellulales bacterium]
MLAVGSFERIGGSTLASVSTGAATPLESKSDVAQSEHEIYAKADATATASGDGFAQIFGDGIAFNLTPIGSNIVAPFVSAKAQFIYTVSGTSFGLSSVGAQPIGGYFSIATGGYNYNEDPGFSEDLVIHVHLYLVANGGIVDTGDASHTANLEIGAAFDSYAASAQYDGENWNGAAILPGWEEPVQFSGAGVNRHFVGEMPYDGSGIYLGASTGVYFPSGVVEAFAYEGSSQGNLGMTVAAWAYVTPAGEDLTPGDFNADGLVNADDYQIWADEDPRADADEDADIDAADFDIWAANATGVIIVSTEVDESDGNYTSGDLSFREAIGLAAGNPGQDAIAFAPSVDHVTLTLGQLTIGTGNNLEIIGYGADELTIEGRIASPARLFQINSGATVSIKGLTMTGGRATSSGGGILNSGNLTLDSVTVSNNTATQFGGGIYSTGSLTIENSTIAENWTSVSSNYSAGGAGVYQYGGPLLALSNSTVQDNWHVSTSAQGGGLFVRNVTSLSIVSSSLEGNTAGSGGAIFISGSNNDNVDYTVIRDSTIANNSAVRHGGLYIFLPNPLASDFNVINTTISNNTAQLQGGGLSFDGGGTGQGLRFTNVTIAENRVTNGTNGGGINVYSTNSDKIRLDNTIVAGNLAMEVASDIYGSVSTSSSYNLIGFGGSGGLSNGVNGNIVLSSGQSAGLAPLAYYGGPTKTHALLSSSLAIDAGDDSKATAIGLLYDERGEGFDRIVDWNGTPETGFDIDIGAFELALTELYT